MSSHTLSSTLSNTLLNKTKKSDSIKHYNILIVDDDHNIANIFKDILVYRGHKVTIITESISCLGKCQDTYYDIIFMDFHMENLNGVELTDIIRDVYKNKSLVFAFTGDDSRSALNLFKENGMDGALIKPIDIEIVSNLMNSLEVKHNIDKRAIKMLDTKQFKKRLFIF